MGISKIGSLFAANVDSLSGYSSNTKSQGDAASASSLPSSNSEAAVVSSSFGRAQAQESEGSRASRVADLKRQVAQGSYKPSSQDVAVTVLRDLA